MRNRLWPHECPHECVGVDVPMGMEEGIVTVQVRPHTKTPRKILEGVRSGLYHATLPYCLECGKEMLGGPHEDA